MRPGRVLVVDASVVVKWFSSAGEIDVERATSLQEEHLAGRSTLLAPALLFYEVSNALRFNPNFSEDAVSEAVSSLFATELLVAEPDEKNLVASVRLALKRRLTVYDSVYLALALEFDAPLITADETFFKKASDTAPVRLLRDMTTRS